MNLVDFILEFWWIVVIGIPLYLIYRKVSAGQGVGKWDFETTKIILFYGLIMVIIYLFQAYIFTSHIYLLFYIMIFLPLFSAFIYILLSKDNVFVIESTMDNEIFYNLGDFDRPVAESTRTRAFIIDREAYKEVRHIGELDYPYWNGGDGVKFTDYYDQKNGVMFHPPIAHLHNVSFFIAKSFWLKMKTDIPDLIRENTTLTWLAPYRTAFEQSKLGENFKLRLRNIERQYEEVPFKLPDDIKELWAKEIEKRRVDREASEVKIPIEPVPITESEEGDSSE